MLIALALTACGGGGGGGRVAPPLLIGISPSQGFASVATPVTLVGSGFTAPASVSIGTEAATDVVVVDASTITCKAPPGSPGATVSVTVTVGGNSASGLQFKYGNPLADLQGTWFGEVRSQTSAQNGGTDSFVVDAFGNATMTALPPLTSEFTVLDEVNRTYRLVRSDALRAIVVLSADKRHIAYLDEFRALGTYERSAIAHADEGYWHADLASSTWSGVGVVPTAAMQIDSVSLGQATISANRSFSFLGVATASVPLALFPAGGIGAERGLFTGDFVGSSPPTGSVFLLESSDKTFAAVAMSLGSVTSTVLGALERTSAPAPAHPIVALATTTLSAAGGCSGGTNCQPATGVFFLGSSSQSLGAITPAVGSADVGQTFFSDRTSSPQLALLFTKLVDGINTTIATQVFGGGSGAPETTRLQNRHPSLPAGPDLAGSRLVNLQFVITHFNVIILPTEGSHNVGGLITYFGRLE